METQMERCPQCGSDRKDRVLLACVEPDGYRNENFWHTTRSTPAAPDIAERRRQITLEVEKLETRITELYKEDRLLGEEVPRG